MISLDAIDGMKRGFVNRRRWGEFVSAVQCSVSYPAVLNALRSGAQWFNAGLQRVWDTSATLDNPPEVS